LNVKVAPATESDRSRRFDKARMPREPRGVKMKFDYEFVFHSLCELAREAGLLWLVFSMLDRLVTATLTVSWSLGNCGAALSLWSVGTLMEARQRCLTGGLNRTETGSRR